MSIDLEKLPKRLTDAARERNLVPFIGAGISRLATTSRSPAFPSWAELLQELAAAAEEGGHFSAQEREQIDALVGKGKFLMAAQAVRSALPADQFDLLMQSRFAPADAEPAPIHSDLFRLRPSLILTTNYDRLLEDAFAKSYQKTPETLTWKDAPLVQRYLQDHSRWLDRPLIFKIHGSVSFPSETIISEMDYRNLLYREPGYRQILSAIFLTRVVLMLGFSFADPEITVLVEGLRESLKHQSSPDYIVLPKGEKGSVERRRLRADFGLEIIEYTPSEGHPELHQLVDYLAGLAEGEHAKQEGGEEMPSVDSNRKPGARRSESTKGRRGRRGT